LASKNIFDLEHAIKMAGAKSMIVSLWQVLDKSTSELMVSFHKHHLHGFSKKESLVKAQNEIKKKYKLPFIGLDLYLLNNLN
jgi:CHAT domain-containing protein